MKLLLSCCNLFLLVFSSYAQKKDIRTEIFDNNLFLKVCDLDNDGDKDIVRMGELNKVVHWYENLDGLGNYGQAKLIVDGFSQLRNIDLGDFDADGDVDIFLLTGKGEFIEVYINDLENGSFTYHSKIYRGAMPWIKRFHCEDIDNDGDSDLMVLPSGGRYIYSSINQNVGKGFKQFEKAIDLKGLVFWSGKFLEFADFNKDGYPDILLHSMTEACMYTNRGGKGHFDKKIEYLKNKKGMLSNTAVVQRGQNQIWDLYLSDSSVKSLLRIQDFTRSSSIDTLASWASTFSIQAIDYNGDKQVDFVLDPSIKIKTLPQAKHQVQDNTDLCQYAELNIFEQEPIFSDLNDDGFIDALIVKRDNIYWIENESGRFTIEHILNHPK